MEELEKAFVARNGLHKITGSRATDLSARQAPEDFSDRLDDQDKRCLKNNTSGCYATQTTLNGIV